MKSGILFLLLLPILCCTQCRKKPRAATHPELRKIHTHTQNWDVHSYVYTYSYGADGRLSRLDVNNGAYSLFAYSGNLIIEQDFDSTNTQTANHSYTLNSNNLIDTAIHISNGIYSFQKRLYDGNGHCVEIRNYDNSNHLTTRETGNLSGNNVLSWKTFNPLGNLSAEWDYTYDTRFRNSTGNYNTGQAYFGNSDANVEATAGNIIAGGASYNYHYNYSFNSDSTISTMYTYLDNNSLLQSDYYTFY